MQPVCLAAIVVFVAVDFLGGPALAAAPAKFDLTCSGQSATPDQPAKPFSTRLSVDRSRKLWCYRDVGCATVFPILSVRGQSLTLLAVKTPLNRADFTVDLAGGAFTRTSGVPMRPKIAASSTGVCKIAPYTPIG